MYKKIIEKIQKIKNDDKKIKDFAILLSLVTVLVLFLFDFSNDVQNYLYLFLIYLLFAMLRPVILKYPFMAWMFLSFFLGDFVFSVLFAIFYYILITPIGYMMRITKGDFLKKGYDKDLKSYWRDYDQTRMKKEKLENLF